MLLYYFRFFEHFQVIEKPLYILKFFFFFNYAKAFTLYDRAIRLLIISIITQVIIEILALSLAENGVILRFNHLRRGDYSGRTNFQNSRLALCQCI